MKKINNNEYVKYKIDELIDEYNNKIRILKKDNSNFNYRYRNQVKLGYTDAQRTLKTIHNIDRMIVDYRYFIDDLEKLKEE